MSRPPAYDLEAQSTRGKRPTLLIPDHSVVHPFETLESVQRELNPFLDTSQDVHSSSDEPFTPRVEKGYVPPPSRPKSKQAARAASERHEQTRHHFLRKLLDRQPRPIVSKGRPYKLRKRGVAVFEEYLDSQDCLVNLRVCQDLNDDIVIFIQELSALLQKAENNNVQPDEEEVLRRTKQLCAHIQDVEHVLREVRRHIQNSPDTLEIEQIRSKTTQAEQDFSHVLDTLEDRADAEREAARIGSKANSDTTQLHPVATSPFTNVEAFVKKLKSYSKGISSDDVPPDEPSSNAAETPASKAAGDRKPFTSRIGSLFQGLVSWLSSSHGRNHPNQPVEKQNGGKKGRYAAVKGASRRPTTGGSEASSDLGSPSDSASDTPPPGKARLGFKKSSDRTRVLAGKESSSSSSDGGRPPSKRKPAKATPPPIPTDDPDGYSESPSELEEDRLEKEKTKRACIPALAILWICIFGMLAYYATSRLLGEDDPLGEVDLGSVLGNDAWNDTLDSSAPTEAHDFSLAVFTTTLDPMADVFSPPTSAPTQALDATDVLVVPSPTATPGLDTSLGGVTAVSATIPTDGQTTTPFPAIVNR